MPKNGVDESNIQVEIGKKLQELRIEKGLSIDDIQEITKIRSRYIQAIEVGNLDKLPGQFYANAFIKSYSEVVGLNPEILNEYKETIPIKEIENVQIRPQYSSLGNPPSKIGKWLVGSLVYILIALILIVAYMFYVEYSPNGEDALPGDPIGNTRLEVPHPPDDEQNEGADKDDNNSGTAKPDEEDKVVEDIVITKVNTSTYNFRPLDTYEIVSAGTNEMNVQLKFTGRCWFDIREGGPDGKQLASTTLGPGQETQVFKLGQKMWIHLGNASGVEFYINDKLIKAGNEQGPKYISITRK